MRSRFSFRSHLPYLVACAMLTSGWVRPLPLSAESTPNQTTATARPVPAATSSQRAMLDQFAAAWSSVAAYTATITVVERKDDQTQKVVLDYAFRKPSSATVHVDAGFNAGVTMVWDGGTTIVAHRGSGFAALFKKSLPLHDPQATTIRGSSIDELSFGAILTHAQQQAGTITETAPSDVDGANVQVVTLASADPSADAGLTREIVALSTVTHLPVQVLGYEGTTLVRQIDFSDVAVQR